MLYLSENLHKSFPLLITSMFQIAYDSWAGKFGLAWKPRCLPSSQIDDGSLVVFVFVSDSLKE